MPELADMRIIECERLRGAMPAFSGAPPTPKMIVEKRDEGEVEENKRAFNVSVV